MFHIYEAVSGIDLMSLGCTQGYIVQLLCSWYFRRKELRIWLFWDRWCDLRSNVKWKMEKVKWEETTRLETRCTFGQTHGYCPYKHFEAEADLAPIY